MQYLKKEKNGPQSFVSNFGLLFPKIGEDKPTSLGSRHKKET